MANDFQLDFIANAQKLDSSIKSAVQSKTYKIKVEADGTQVQSLTKSTEKFVDAQGRAIQVNTNFDKSGKATSATIKDITKETKSAGTAITSTSKKTKSLGADFVSTLGKVAKFYAITKIIQTFTQGIDEAVQAVKEFDDAVTDFKKVSDLSGDSLDAYTEKLGELGSTVARTRTEMVSSATEFVRSGFSEEDSAQLAQVAELYRNVADAEISSAESAQFITSQIKAFNLDANDAITILDQLNAVSNNYAVSSTDIATALSKTSSAMATLGNTSQETIGLVTAGTEQLTGQASKVAKGLRTIGLNIAKTATDSGELNYQIGNTTKNISLLDESTGDMKSTFQVLSEIAEDWDKMSNAEKTAIGQTLAGKNQYEVFSAVLNQFDDALSATQTALNSQGSAMEENSKYMESMGAKLNELKGQFQELVLGEGGLNKFLKGLIDLGTGILKFLNYTDGLQVGLTAISILLAIKIIPKLILFGSTLVTNIGQIALFTAETGSLSAGLKAVGISASTAQIALGGLTLILSAGVMVWNAYKQAQEDAKNSALESVSSLDSYTSSIQSTINKINDESASKKSLIEMTSKLDGSYDSEKAQLKDIIELRKDAIEKLYEEAKAKAQTTITETGAQASKAEKFLTSPYGKGASVTVTEDGSLATPEEQLKIYKEIIDSYNNRIQKGEKLNKLEQAQFESTTKAYTELNTEIEENKAIVDKNNEARKISSMSLEEWLSYAKEEQSQIENNTQANGELSDEEEELSSTTESAKSSLESLNDSLDSLQSSYSLLTSIVDEYNSNQGLSIGSIQNLLSLSEEYGSALSFENGILTLNEQVLQDRANALLENAKQEVYSQTMTKLNAIAQADVSTAMKIAKGEIDATTDSLNANATAYSSAGVSAYAYSILNGQGQKASAVTKVLSDMETQITLVESAVDSMGKTFDKASGSTKSLTDSLKEQQSQYEKVIGFIKDKLNDEIDSIKEKRDAQLKAIDDEIDALKDENDELENQLELQTLLENLAKAKATKVKVYREGQGFVYESDESTVSEAQQKLDEYYLKQSYDKKLADLENYKDSVEDSYNEQIDNYKNYINQFDDLTNNYENTQDALLAKQLTGIDFEQEGWQTRLGNLTNFVNNYNSILSKLGTNQTVSTPSKETKSVSNVPTTKKITSAIGGGGGGSGTRRMMAYASGVDSVGSNQFSVVGENPNKEIVIGSKLNNGIAMNLAKGTGVVNAKSTNTLAGILNNLGGLNSKSNPISNNTKTVQNNFNITANVQDGQDLVDYLQDFSTRMTQNAYA